MEVNLLLGTLFPDWLQIPKWEILLSVIELLLSFKDKVLIISLPMTKPLVMPMSMIVLHMMILKEFGPIFTTVMDLQSKEPQDILRLVITIFNTLNLMFLIQLLNIWDLFWEDNNLIIQDSTVNSADQL